jgi:hypothetical protein
MEAADLAAGELPSEAAELAVAAVDPQSVRVQAGP